MAAEERRPWPWLRIGGGEAAYARGPYASVRSGSAGSLDVRIEGSPRFSIASPVVDAPSARLAPFRYERVGAGLIERVDVLPDRAAVVALWHPAEGAACTPPRRVAVLLPSGVSVSSLASSRLAVCSDDGAGLLLATDRAAGWHIEARADGVEIGIDAAPPLRIACAACDATGRPVRGVEPVLGDPSIAERIVAAAHARMHARGLHVTPRTPVLGDALEWARARLAAARPVAGAQDAVATTTGLCASGDHEAACDRLAVVARGDTPPDAAAFVLAFARAFAWTGRLDLLTSRREDLLAALGAIAAVDVVPDAAGGARGWGAALLAAALGAGARLAESLAGQADLSARLTSRARRLRAPAHASAVFDSGAADDGGPAGILRALDDLEANRIRAGGRRLEAAASDVLRSVRSDTLDERAAAAWCSAVAMGLMGIVPDAGRDRVTLRPRLTRTFLPVVANGIRVGEAVLELGVAIEDGTWTLTVEQTAGAVPIQLVLEPWIPAGRFGSVRVDGRPARLDARPVDDGWVLPLQLVPDRPRRMEVELDANAGPP